MSHDAWWLKAQEIARDYGMRLKWEWDADGGYVYELCAISNGLRLVQGFIFLSAIADGLTPKEFLKEPINYLRHQVIAAQPPQP